MNILPRPLWKTAFHCYSDKSVEALKADIQRLFDASKGWNSSINLTGKFNSEYGFRMWPKWQLAMISNFERKISYLEGQISTDQEGRTRVRFTVRPNSIFLILFIIFPVFGIMAFLSEDNGGGINEASIMAVVFTFVIPAIMLAIGYLAKKAIKDRFVATFGLKQIG